MCLFTLFSRLRHPLFHRYPIAVWIILAAFPGRLGVAAEPAPDDAGKLIAGLAFTAEVKRAEIHEQHETLRKTLAGKYMAAVEKLAEGFQKDGDLESLLLARKEIEHVKKHHQSGKSEFPAVTTLREVLAKELQVIADSESTAVRGMYRNDLLPKLENLKVALTQAGRLDDAILIKNEIDKITASLGTGDDSPAAVPAPEGGELGKIADSPILGDLPVEKDLNLEAGIYDLGGKKATIGIRASKTAGPRRPKVMAMPGATFQNGTLFVETGAFTAERGYFKEMNLSANLAGSVTVEDSLLQDCTMSKDGAWVTAMHSSKWIFSNCVIAGSFFKGWGSKGAGVQIEDCTFHGIQFPSFTYLKDAADEAKHQWTTIRNCLFVKCEIPETVLIATQDCVFEDCTFRMEEKYPASRTLEVTISSTDTLPAPPETSAKAKVTVLPVSAAGHGSGASLGYDYSGGELRRMGN